MRRILFTSLLLTQTIGAFATSLCEPGEAEVFTCRISQSAKIASLCSIVKTVKGEKRAATLLYRFGKPGSPELQFPSSPDRSLQKFKFSHYFRPQFDSTNISFSVNSYTYNVFDTTDGEGNQQKPERTAGVSVSSRLKKGAELSCSPSSTKANWFLIDGVIPCEEDEGTPNSCSYNS